MADDGPSQKNVSDLQLLHLICDGELSTEEEKHLTIDPGRSQAIREALATPSSSLGTTARKLGTLGAMIRQGLAEDADAHLGDADALFAQIEARIRMSPPEKATEVAIPQSKTMELASKATGSEASQKSPSQKAAKPDLSLVSGKKSEETPRKKSKRRVWLPLGAGLAAAAAVTIAVVNQSNQKGAMSASTQDARNSGPRAIIPIKGSPSDHAQRPRTVNPIPALAQAAMVARGTAVVEADFRSTTGTVFDVDGEDGQTLAVVWIHE